MLVRPFVSRVCLFFVVSLLEDGQFRPKHVVVLKILKVTSVENTEKCFKTLTSRSESEIAMYDRMQMYNIT
jgi:hypothetical protein